MPIVFYISGISLIITTVLIWRVFHVKAIKKMKKKLLYEEIEAKRKIVIQPVEVKKKEVFYKLNVYMVRLNLYSKSSFSSYEMKNLYQNMVIDTYWLNEPFHSDFSIILQFVGANNLWIKDPKSREIITNIRDRNNKINKQILMNVLDLGEVINGVVTEVYSNLNKRLFYNKYEIQDRILAAAIYVLIKAKEIEFVCKILKIEYTNEVGLRHNLVGRFYENLSTEKKDKITQNDYFNSSFIISIYEEVIFNSNQYPYTFSTTEPSKCTVTLLPYTPKKQLMSI